MNKKQLEPAVENKKVNFLLRIKSQGEDLQIKCELQPIPHSFHYTATPLQLNLDFTTHAL